MNGATSWGPIAVGGAATVTGVLTGAATVEEDAAGNGWRRLGLLAPFGGSCPTDPAAYDQDAVTVVADAAAEVCVLNDQSAQQVRRTLLVGHVIVSANPDATAAFGGSANPSGLSWTFNHNQVLSFPGLETNVYTVAEAAKAGYVILGYRVFYDGRASCPAANGAFDSTAYGVADLTPKRQTVALVCVYNQPVGAITVNKVLVPNTDDGRFTLLVDGVTAGMAVGVGDGGSSGKMIVIAGRHTVGEAARPGTDLGQYTSAIWCSTGTSATFDVAPGQEVVCTITNTRKVSPLAVLPALVPTAVANPSPSAVNPVAAAPTATALPAATERPVQPAPVALGDATPVPVKWTPSVAPLPPNTGSGREANGDGFEASRALACLIAAAGLGLACLGHRMRRAGGSVPKTRSGGRRTE